ncbi:MAG: aspartate/glutamate racemase family protein [Betaproteobacteria bacterium]
MKPTTPQRILLINPNTTATVTARLQSHLRPLLPQGTQLHARTATYGAPYIGCESSHAVAACAVLQAWADEPHADAVLIGCFGDPGLFALREHSEVPVTGLAEAAFIEAAVHGPFAVVTGGQRWKPMLMRLAPALGYGSSLVHIETMTPTGAQMLADPVLAREHLSRAVRHAAASGAKSIIIGGAGLAGWALRLQEESPVPLIDSVEAGLRVLLDGSTPPPLPAASPRPELVRWFPVMGRSSPAA